MATATADDDKPYNSFSLRAMVEHLLRTQRPESAEEILKKTDVEGHGVAFSWNLCLKYYAKQGDIGECDRIYQLVTSP
jgi:pentatricopeptide repeat protein